jgi:hypothetical protein
VRAALVAAALLLAGPAAAQDCRLALSLGLDVSSSVSTREYRLQADGLAAALTDPAVAEAFLMTPGARVALHVFEWSGTEQQRVVIGWSWVEGPADLAAAAALLRRTSRSFAQYPTAIGHAMAYGAAALAAGPECGQRTLDLSGDGTNNDGPSPPLIRASFSPGALTINGLVIGASRTTLRRYYEQFVIHGPDAFVEEADDYADFEAAMRRKLLRELGVPRISGLQPAAGAPPTAFPDALVRTATE